MKWFFTGSVLSCLYTILSCNYISRQPSELAIKDASAIPSTAIRGDFDGDGKQEYAWMVPSKLSGDSMSCANNKCVSYLEFSNKYLKRVALDSVMGGTLTNVGDLNSDGRDEIGLLPDWFQGCWRSYFVYTYQNSRWTYLVPPFPVHCNEMESGVKPIEKDTKHRGHVLVRYSKYIGNGDIVTMIKSEAIK